MKERRITSRLHILVAEKATRDRRKLSQETVARESGVPIVSVRNYWHNKVRRFDEVTLVALCNYLGCDLCDLLVMEEAEVGGE